MRDRRLAGYGLIGVEQTVPTESMVSYSTTFYYSDLFSRTYLGKQPVIEDQLLAANAGTFEQVDTGSHKRGKWGG